MTEIYVVILFGSKAKNTDIAIAIGVALVILEQERWEMFNSYYEKLSENCKSVLKLFFDKVSYAHIVKRLDYNTETVARQRVFKCKNKLKELISSDKRFNSLTSL